MAASSASLDRFAHGRGSQLILEHRAYTPLPGNASAFWDAQVKRGFELVQPLMERAMGYFQSVSGPVEQIVHLYRYDDLADWQARLHGLYGVKELEPYFREVRPLLSRQVNAIYVPAPLEQLNPLFGGGRDWLPESGPIVDASAHPELVVEQRTLTLHAGSLPAYWEAYQKHGLAGSRAQGDRLIGVFQSMIGVQHQVLHYRWFENAAEMSSRHRACAGHPEWQAFEAAIRPRVASHESQLLAPSPVREMCPLFFP